MRLALVLLFAACGQTSRQPGSSSAEPAGDAEPVALAPPVEGKARGTTPSTTRPAAKPPAANKPPAPSTEQPGSVAEQWVDVHNRYRAKHCAKPLTWSPKLASIAQKWADTLKAKGCAFGHSPGAKYGENLAGGTSGALDPESATTMWYDEIQKYKFPNGGFSMETGHFTQVVWTTTTHVGCGQVTCKGMDIFVCNYDPPGNWEGQYRQHVLPLGCK